MEIGPVDYLLATFVDGKFRGEIVSSLAGLVDRGIIRILDLVFISKDETGAVIAAEIDSLEGELAEIYANLDGEYGGLLSDEDLANAAEDLPPGTAAGILVWENIWAREFNAALENAGGALAVLGRIPAENVQQAFAALAED